MTILHYHCIRPQLGDNGGDFVDDVKTHHVFLFFRRHPIEEVANFLMKSEKKKERHVFYLSLYGFIGHRPRGADDLCFHIWGTLSFSFFVCLSIPLPWFLGSNPGLKAKIQALRLKF